MEIIINSQNVNKSKYALVDKATKEVTQLSDLSVMQSDVIKNNQKLIIQTEQRRGIIAATAPLTPQESRVINYFNKVEK